MRISLGQGAGGFDCESSAEIKSDENRRRWAGRDHLCRQQTHILYLFDLSTRDLCILICGPHVQVQYNGVDHVSTCTAASLLIERILIGKRRRFPNARHEKSGFRYSRGWVDGAGSADDGARARARPVRVYGNDGRKAPECVRKTNGETAAAAH